MTVIYCVKVKDNLGRFSDHTFESEIGRTLFVIKCEQYGGKVIDEWTVTK